MTRTHNRHFGVVLCAAILTTTVTPAVHSAHALKPADPTYARHGHGVLVAECRRAVGEVLALGAHAVLYCGVAQSPAVRFIDAPQGRAKFAWREVPWRTDSVPDFERMELLQMFVHSAVPEPASWAMLVTGFGMVGLARRRRHVTVAA